ncbi:hypothetical protein BJ742DRAFT_680429, partial [Cladochytrium replicatum]
VRTIESKVSTRVPKGFITLSAEPAAAISEFGSEVDSKTLDNLDQKLSRFKEVEELYDEIMKTVVGSHLENHDPEDALACVSAPFDPQFPIPNVFLGLSDFIKVPTVEQGFYQTLGFIVPASAPMALAAANNIATPTVLVSPDEFGADRKKAMSKTPSSRYGTFKYNYGGYIPYDFETRRRIRRQLFCVSDYVEYLRTRTSDFIVQMLVDEIEEAEEAKRKADEVARKRAEAEERGRVETERAERTGRKDEMLKYRKGLWNTKILEYLEELDRKGREADGGQTDAHTMQMNDLEGDYHGRPTEKRLARLGKQAKESNSNISSSQDALQKPISALEFPVPSNKVHLSPLVRTESFVDIASVQPKLEKVWMMLKTPSDQRLSMAIKYGSHGFAPKLQKAIDMWEMLAEHVVQREALMQEIEEFEKSASDPVRFFRRGFEGSSEARLMEARSREELMRRLHYLEARIQEESSVIKHDFNETITYEGIPYLEKMKHDYTDLTFRLQSRREVMSADDAVRTVWSASGSAVRSLTRAGTAETQGTRYSMGSVRRQVALTPTLSVSSVLMRRAAVPIERTNGGERSAE